MGACMTTTPTNFTYGAPMRKQNQNQTPAIRHQDHLQSLQTTPEPQITTAFHAIMSAVQRHPSKKLLGTRRGHKYIWRTYSQIQSDATALGSAILNMNLTVPQIHDGKEYSFIGIQMINRQQWIISDIASIFYNICNVPLYSTLGNDAMAHILQQTNMRLIITSSDCLAPWIAMKKEGKTSALQFLVVVDLLPYQVKMDAERSGLVMYTFRQLLEFGSQQPMNYREPTREDIFTICYTSGTTGLPKGVMLSHGNLVAAFAGTMKLLDPSPKDVYLSYLPLAHIYQRFVCHLCIYRGIQIGFFGGDIFKIVQDLGILRPTLFASVPRLLMRIYDRIQARFAALPGSKAKLAAKAVRVKLQKFRSTGNPHHCFYDALVFKKVKKLMGGRVRKVSTAAAPISAEVIQFLSIAFCCPVLQGYGQTECTGACSGTREGQMTPGHVGGPTSSCELKLVDIPEMNYTSKDRDENGRPMPRGQVCIRGDIVCKGYFKMPQETAETIDSEGWLHTGDVGTFLPNYALKLIDRKKNIFKLAQGEYVAPEKVENVYVRSPYVALAYVHGDSLQSHLVGVMCPERETVENWAKKKGHDMSFEQLCQSEVLNKKIMKSITKLGNVADLKGFEQVKRIYLYPELITPDSGLLTPTFKIKRYDMREFFRKVLDQLYES